MLEYSANKNKSKDIPATNSDSASGKSKGCRLVSAKPEIKNIKNGINKGTTYQT